MTTTTNSTKGLDELDEAAFSTSTFHLFPGLAGLDTTAPEFVPHRSTGGAAPTLQVGWVGRFEGSDDGDDVCLERFPKLVTRPVLSLTYLFSSQSVVSIDWQRPTRDEGGKKRKDWGGGFLFVSFLRFRH